MADTFGSNQIQEPLYHFLKGQLALAQAEKKAADKKLKRVRQECMNRGVALKEFDRVQKIKDVAPETVLDNERTFAQYAAWEGLPYGLQVTFHDKPRVDRSKAGETNLEERAFAEGRRLALEGLEPDTEAWMEMSPEGQQHLAGHAEGRREHQEMLREWAGKLAVEPKRGRPPKQKADGDGGSTEGADHVAA